MDEKMRLEKGLDQLGLPPMELAESNDQNNNGTRRCFPFIQKIVAVFLTVLFFAGAYIIIMSLLQEEYGSTEIFIVNQGAPNITIAQGNVEIFVQIKNKTVDHETKRIKREIRGSSQDKKSDYLRNLDDKKIRQAREIIMQTNVDCNNGNGEEICKNLVTAIESLNDNEKTARQNEEERVSSGEISQKKNISPSTEKSKRETSPLDNLETHMPQLRHPFEVKGSYGYVPEPLPAPILPYAPHAPVKLADSCLLARFLKQNYPQATHDITGYAPLQYENHHTQYSRSPPPAHVPHFKLLDGRDTDPLHHSMHPQDAQIFFNFLSTQPTERSSNSSKRETECAAGTVSCANGEGCISEKQWCDGNVDCSDVSDESQCSCKTRVDKARLCDGYFDCPFGEDEMGCYGCSDSAFSCIDLDVNSQGTCFTKEQRCNNMADCPNQRDELDCTMLSPSLHKPGLFAVSNTEGFLHRNFKGDWYAVCKNPYMWAHDACRRETGLIIRPPFIQVLPVDPLMKVNYLNTGEEGMLHMSNTCFNNSAIYVTCPDLLCGTRIMPSTQILRENFEVENNLYGRNKRFLVTSHPYPVLFYNNRAKRHIVNTTETERMRLFENVDGNKNNLRKKRTESRVVGGKPSQPADWPWMVAMYKDGMFHCGGVILTQKWVISAAHCVHKFWEHYFEIRVGMLRRFSFSPQEHNHKVTHVIVNQFYNKNDMKNDIALLKVKPAIQFSRWVRPICLPGPETAGQEWLWGPPAGTMCTAVGWGATVEQGQDPDHMREVEVPVWSHCKRQEDRDGKEICAGLNKGGRDACQGDSGGPLLCKNPLNPQQWYMAGIVSHGDGCGRENEPGVYTRVSLFVKWIRYHIFSDSLPTIQPKQECPSFMCLSGIPKCLPAKKVCDKIVDCLGGEDEMKCDSMRSTQHFGNSFVSHVSAKENKVKEREVESFENTTVAQEVKNKTSPANISVEDNASQKTRSRIENNIDNVRDLKETNLSYSREAQSSDIDFTEASTLELPNTKSAESIFHGREIETTTSFTTNEEITNRSNLEDSLSISFTQNSLESRAFVTQASFLKEADIQEDWSNEETTLISAGGATISSIDVINIDKQVTRVETTTEGKDLIESTNAISAETHNSVRKTTVSTSDFLKPESKDLLFDLSDSNVTPSLHKNKPINAVSTLHAQNANGEQHDESNAKIIKIDELPIANKIKDIVSSVLEVATVKRKHRLPKEFECRRIQQVIPYHLRCDRKADCEDGTDELSCSCTDYLARFDQKLLCDGIIDCADGQDELDCFSCPEDHFLCHKSKQCLPQKYVCDEKPHCPLGEDELDCYALTNGQSLDLDFAGKPKISLQGFLTKKHDRNWHVVCDKNLSTEQQEVAAGHICRYLGFSSANRYLVKHINIKEEDILVSDEQSRDKRNIENGIPVHFAYRKADDTARHIIINEPEVLNERCVPNVTKTCMSLYVYCDRALYTNSFDLTNEIFYDRNAESTPDTNMETHMWPWVAKVFVDGDYRCTGVLVDLSLVLISHSCLWDTSLGHHQIKVVLGSHRTLATHKGVYEQIYKVNAKKDLYHTKALILLLKQPANYSRMVKPMIISTNMQDAKSSVCVAIGQDERNNTVGMFVQETNENCDIHNRCFVKTQKENNCAPGMVSRQPWAGIISCHSEHGWYPAATFVDSRGECGIGDHIIATDIGNLKNEMKHHYSDKELSSESTEMSLLSNCDGVRCGRGRCIPLAKVCDGVSECEDRNDEEESACEMKKEVCSKKPYPRGCECSTGELKCHNGKCVAKELYKNGVDDCGDGTDEPSQMTCSHYLARVKPSRLCDGILHCKDRSDEDPMFCKCFSKGYRCNRGPSDVELCVSHDVVCDGVSDCPGGEDEQTCLALSAPEGTTYGTGQVIHRSHGVWHTKCYSSQSHTKSELEAICRELGFIGGHAKQLNPPVNLSKPSKYIIDQFNEIMLNGNTSISIRNTNEPLAKAVIDESMENCYPVYIECL